MKSEVQKLAPKSESAPRPRASPEAPREDEPLELADGGPAAPGKEAGVGTAQEITGLPFRHGRGVRDAGPAGTEDGLPATLPGPGLNSSAPAGGGSVQGAEPARTPPLHLDGSVFLDEDSNQPMPVSRFFGNVELMQVGLRRLRPAWGLLGPCALAPQRPCAGSALAGTRCSVLTAPGELTAQWLAHWDAPARPLPLWPSVGVGVPDLPAGA